MFKAEVQSSLNLLHDKVDTLLQAGKIPVPTRRRATAEVQEVEPQVGCNYRVTNLRRLETLNIKDIWQEWTVGVDVGGGKLEAPLKELEANKKDTPYRDLSNKGLKTAVFRRKDIGSHLEKRIAEFQQRDGVTHDVAVSKAIEEAELRRKSLGKKGKKCSLYRYWLYINNYK